MGSPVPNCGMTGRRRKRIGNAEADMYRRSLREKAAAGDTVAEGFLFLAHTVDHQKVNRLVDFDRLTEIVLDGNKDNTGELV